MDERSYLSACVALSPRARALLTRAPGADGFVRLSREGGDSDLDFAAAIDLEAAGFLRLVARGSVDRRVVSAVYRRTPAGEEASCAAGAS